MIWVLPRGFTTTNGRLGRRFRGTSFCLIEESSYWVAQKRFPRSLAIGEGTKKTRVQPLGDLGNLSNKRAKILRSGGLGVAATILGSTSLRRSSVASAYFYRSSAHIIAAGGTRLEFIGSDIELG